MEGPSPLRSHIIVTEYFIRDSVALIQIKAAADSDRLAVRSTSIPRVESLQQRQRVRQCQRLAHRFDQHRSLTFALAGDHARDVVIPDLQCDEAVLVQIAIDSAGGPISSRGRDIRTACRNGKSRNTARFRSASPRPRYSPPRRGPVASCDAPVLDADLLAAIRKTRDVAGHVKSAGRAQGRIDNNAAVVRLARAGDKSPSPASRLGQERRDRRQSARRPRAPRRRLSHRPRFVPASGQFGTPRRWLREGGGTWRRSHGRTGARNGISSGATTVTPTPLFA